MLRYRVSWRRIKEREIWGGGGVGGLSGREAFMLMWMKPAEESKMMGCARERDDMRHQQLSCSNKQIAFRAFKCWEISIFTLDWSFSGSLILFFWRKLFWRGERGIIVCKWGVGSCVCMGVCMCTYAWKKWRVCVVDMIAVHQVSSESVHNILRYSATYYFRPILNGEGLMCPLKLSYSDPDSDLNQN